jgi:hypothetical protein
MIVVGVVVLLHPAASKALGVQSAAWLNADVCAGSLHAHWTELPATVLCMYGVYIPQQLPDLTSLIVCVWQDQHAATVEWSVCALWFVWSPNRLECIKQPLFCNQLAKQN